MCLCFYGIFIGFISSGDDFKKHGGGSWRFTPPKPTRTFRMDAMIIKCFVSINEIIKKGKKYNWIKPPICPCCFDSLLWGHGFTLCYFSIINSGIYLKRYRCTSCKSIIKLKPAGFFKGFRTPVKTIIKSITSRMKIGKIIKNISRGVQDYWLKNLKRNVQAILGEKWKHFLIEGFENLLKKGIIPVSCSVYKTDT